MEILRWLLHLFHFSHPESTNIRVEYVSNPPFVDIKNVSVGKIRSSMLENSGHDVRNEHGLNIGRDVHSLGLTKYSAHATHRLRP